MYPPNLMKKFQMKLRPSISYHEAKTCPLNLIYLTKLVYRQPSNSSCILPLKLSSCLRAVQYFAKFFFLVIYTQCIFRTAQTNLPISRALICATQMELTNPSLPQELITDILVRLPVKYLLQFKCVSKEWFDLISSPEFVKTHLSFSAKDYTRHQILLRLGKSCQFLKHCSVSALCNESVTESFDLDHPMKNPNKFVRIVGSVNGLICLNIGPGRLVLWNPSTRKFKKLPDLLHTQDSDYWCRFAFGYDEVHDDYKVVAMLCKENNRCVDARIYSLKRDHSRRLDDVQYGVMFPDSAKFVNGKLYWISKGGNDWVIVSVYLVDEKCRQLEQPCHEEGIYTLKIGVLGSDISVLCSYIDTTDLQKNLVDIWVMKEYGIKESWTKLYTIKNPFDHVNCGNFPPPFMSIKGEILLVRGSTLAIYNPEDDSARYLEVTNIDSPVVAELYIESLVCPILQSEAMI